ncbi:hypothetical protein DPMN_115993 [Dreissena polymorpha]|uniref:Uncharacterized protein n=1 Tax=Dreissena polymorpha TaxID=45954 RepID=A0A9D4KM90_DREPO|nr:hypothetical protein DPMN_115993 [Dreissena polymorpha]
MQQKLDKRTGTESTLPSLTAQRTSSPERSVIGDSLSDIMEGSVSENEDRADDADSFMVEFNSLYEDSQVFGPPIEKKKGII